MAAVRASGRVVADRVRDGQLEVVVSERELDAGAPGAVPGTIRERLLEDPVSGPINGSRERLALAGGGDGHRQAGGVVLGEQRVERREPGGRFDLVRRRSFLAQRVDDLVNLGDGTVGDHLDRLERRSRPGRILLLPQACRARLDRDHVDRVCRRVVQVACDPGALLGEREAAILERVPLGLDRALLELLDLLPPQARALAGEPRQGPHERADRDLNLRQLPVAEGERQDVHAEHADDDRCLLHAPRPAAASRYSAIVGPTGGPAG